MEDKKSYYECKSCSFICYQKNTMKGHLDKLKKCDRNLDSYKYNESDLYNLSLIRILNNNKKVSCNICNKKFTNIYTLKRHQTSFHGNEIINTDNDTDIVKDTNINKDNNIKINEDNIKNNSSTSCINNTINGNNNNLNIVNNNNNISINIINFDENWNTEHIDDEKKILLLLKKYKFTSTLENILENEVNLNVLIDKTGEDGLVLQNNKFEKMNVKEIVQKTMKKLMDFLNIFNNEIHEKRENEFNLQFLDTEIKDANMKYDEFKKNEITQNKVNEYIHDIYIKKKNNTFNNFKLLGY